MSKKSFLSLNAMDKLLRDAGAHRVSDEAKVALAQILEEKAQILGKQAVTFAQHAGRKTVTDKDIYLAAKE